MIRERWVGEKEKEKNKTGREEILTGKRKEKRSVGEKRKGEREGKTTQVEKEKRKRLRGERRK